MKDAPHWTLAFHYLQKTPYAYLRKINETETANNSAVLAVAVATV